MGKRGWGEAQRYIGPNFLGLGALNTTLRLPLNSSHQESFFFFFFRSLENGNKLFSGVV